MPLICQWVRNEMHNHLYRYFMEITFNICFNCFRNCGINIVVPQISDHQDLLLTIAYGFTYSPHKGVGWIWKAVGT